MIDCFVLIDKNENAIEQVVKKKGTNYLKFILPAINHLQATRNINTMMEQCHVSRD